MERLGNRPRLAFVVAQSNSHIDPILTGRVGEKQPVFVVFMYIGVTDEAGLAEDQRLALSMKDYL